MTAWHSLLPGDDLEPEVSRALRTALEDILGWPRQSKQRLDEVFHKYPQEAEALVDIFRLMSEGDPSGAPGWLGNRKWKRATQSSRTAVPFTCDETGRLILSERTQHSHGFLTVGSIEEGRNALEGRRFLCGQLRRCLAVEEYEDLLQWVENPVELKPPSVRDRSGTSNPRVTQEMAGDSALGCAFYFIDACFEGIFDALVSKWRDERGVDGGFATPTSALESIAEETGERVKRLIEMAAHEGREAAEDDSLILRLAATVSVNRAVDELWSRCSLELEALHNAEKLFALLTKAAITRVPREFLDDPPAAECDSVLNAWLIDYLGPQGKLCKADHGPRPMTYAQISAAVAQSAKLQADYVLKQCGGGREAHAELQYGGSDVRFIFLIALLAAHAFKSRVPNEFTGGNSPTKAVFAPQTANSNSPFVMPAHAVTLIERMVALIHRTASKNWGFDVGALRAGAESKVRRLEIQALMHRYAVDGRTAQEIFGVYNFLVRVRIGSPRAKFGGTCAEAGPPIA